MAEHSSEGGTRGAEVTAIDADRIASAVAEILEAIGEDPGLPGLVDTPRRVADTYRELFSGIGVDPLMHLADLIPVGVDGIGNGDLVLVRDIEFRSVCEHHLLPFAGVAHLAYLPSTRIVGLGRLPPLIDTLASRPQLQERLTEEIADALQTGLDPRGVLVVLEASHQCVTARGPRQSRSSTVTTAARGELTETHAAAGVLAMIGGAHDRRDA